MNPLHEVIASNARPLRYTLGVLLLIGGGIILAVKVWNGLHG